MMNEPHSRNPVERTPDTMTPAEHSQIVTAAHDYIDGWYTGDAARMERALHPALAKRIQTADSTGTLTVADMSARELIDRTAAGIGTSDPTRRSEVRCSTCLAAPRPSASTPAVGSTTCT